ncbi:MAG TPA: hypothetical protein VGQ17_00800 [Gemmatimonadales bacterium]|jgi:hypothetical protein|nr:hypothetical protein [Gemmatimonadales bacterium]
MSDPTVPDEPLDEPPAAPPAPPERRRWWRHWKLILGIVLATPVAVFAFFTLATLTWSYSEGQRSGYLQKFSKRGWICKTWEGELAMTTVPGVAPTLWSFTVRRAAVARQVNLGIGRRVIMFYREHRGVPSRCFGDTDYFVDSVRIVK